MKYLEEFFSNWRQLLAASVGMAFGYTLNNYLNNVFIPPLVQEFSWPRSLVALIGLPAVLSFVFQPLAGHLTDRLGVRSVALFGVIVAPLIYLALSAMSGSFTQFFILNLLQIALVASTTGAVVYSRLIAQDFNLARGMALALIACTPSVAGIFVAPILSDYIDQEGWRAAYVAVAAVTGLTGLLAVMLIPSSKADKHKAVFTLKGGRSDYGAIIRNPAFKYIVLGMGLCSISVTVQASQLKLVIESMGVTSQDASWMISMYASGVIGGRLACGAALDRFPAHRVAAISLGLPGVGLSLIALGVTSPLVVALAVLLLGLSLGTELDVAGYLIMRFFPVEVYSTVIGIVIGAIAVSGSLGSLLLSISLNISDSYSIFLMFSAICAFFGANLFISLGGISPHERGNQSANEQTDLVPEPEGRR